MALDGYVRVAKHAGLNETSALLDALSGLEGTPAEVADRLKYHHVIRLVHCAVPDDVLRARLPPALVDALESRRRIGRVPVRTLLAAFDDLNRSLAAARVPVLLLKGFYFAERLYGGLDRRPQHDLDLLVPSKDFRCAVRGLRGLGFVRKSRDLHSLSFIRDQISVDLHRYLRWAPAYALDEAAIWSTAVDVHVQGVAMRTLSDEYSLVMLATASFEDLGQGTCKLKPLLDLYLLLRQIDPTTDWEAFFARRERENLLAVTVNVLALATELFASDEELPRLGAALARRRHLCVLTDRDAVLALVFAPRKHDPNLMWFRRIYPGSMTHYLAWFWYAGFPANAGRFIPALRSGLRLAESWRATRSVASHPPPRP
jgi:hypothetical protein